MFVPTKETENGTGPYPEQQKSTLTINILKHSSTFSSVLYFSVCASSTSSLGREMVRVVDKGCMH